MLTLDSSDSEYIGTLELLTNKRKAIVNSTLLRNRSETEDSITQQLQLSSLQHDNNSIFINKIKVKSGDFIRIGFSNYKIYREDDSIILDNILFESILIYKPILPIHNYNISRYSYRG